MFGTRLHRLMTLYLAAVYGLVGLTGESLHYLATSPVSFWSHSPATATIVYYHTHGPDYHGHFHRHTHHGHHSHGPNDAANRDNPTDRSAAVAPQQSIHDPHACPLLTLVSTLKLGHGGCCCALIPGDSLVSEIWQPHASLALDVARTGSARGPPSCSCA